MASVLRALTLALILATSAPLFGAGRAGAQDATPLPPPVLTLDQERLFAQSRAAGQISDEIERRSAELAAENRRIEAELSAEELDLTERRETLPPDEFRALADAFDAKVERLRTEQDAKERDLQRLREEERQNFLRRITPILTQLARERGALVILERRTVILSADTIDVTDAAIERIDEALLEAPLGLDTPDAAPDAPEQATPPEDPAPETLAPPAEE